MQRNKTAIECWNILKYEIESITDQFVPLKNKENGLERNTCQKCTKKQKLACNIKNDGKCFFAYVRSKQNVQDKIGPLEDSAGNNNHNVF